MTKYLYFCSKSMVMAIRGNINPFLTSILSLITCVSLHAGEAVDSTVIFDDGNAVIVGKEYLFVKSALSDENTSEVQNTQFEICSNDSSCIFIAENAVIVGKEYLYAKQDTSSRTFAKNSSKTKSKIPEPVKNNINNVTEREPSEIIVPDFPFDLSSLSYSYISKGSAVTVLRQRLHGYRLVVYKVNSKNTYRDIENSNLSLYLSEQRQKLSTAASQCGILTSFSPNSPSL